MDRKIYKIIILVFAILSLNNIILLIRNYSYAYFEKNIKTGVKLKITTLDEMPVKGSPSANTLKEKLGQPGEIIGVTNDNQKVTTDNGNIREYRYSGLSVNNYVYFNCNDDMEQNSSNCETWRIIGIFKDEEGNENIKIVKNEILKRNMFPITFYANNKTYKIQVNKVTNSSGDYAYWNYITGGSSDKNDWATGGLQYWLNAGSDKETKSSSDGYMSYLSKSAKSMVEDKTKYYLGSVTFNNSNGSYMVQDTPNEAYKNERDIKSCEGNMGSSATQSGCKVWAGNQATWNGSIALLYPSDYGYSADSEYWSTKLGRDSFDGTPSNSSWLQKEANHSSSEWLLSPSSFYLYNVIYWEKQGYFYENGVSFDIGYSGVRPCLYLKSNVKIIDGTGESGSPYQLEYTE